MEKYMPFDYYTDMAGIILDSKVFDSFISKYCPKILRHLKKLNVEPILFTMQWFLCAYSYNLPCESVIRIWDIFFCEGHSFLFKVALAILHIYRKNLFAIDNMNLALEYLSKMSNNLTDIDLLLETTEKFPISIEEIEEKRKFFNEISEFPNISFTCTNEKSCKALQVATSDYFTFKNLSFNHIQENYWENPSITKKAKCLLRLSGDEDLVIGVKNHHCSKEIPKKRLSKIFQIQFPGHAKIAMPRISLSPFFLQTTYQEIIELEIKTK
jgi:hypothetical protein